MLAEKNKCTGCSACSEICPHNAIEMERDEEGFLFPIVKENCTKCGLCENICPILNVITFNKAPEKAYAVWIGDDNMRLKSSSGGFFNILTDYVLSKQGIVFGSVFSDDFLAIHKGADNKEDCAKFAGSKYLESDLLHTFSETKKALKGGKTVLFSGLPCQIGGLYAFLSKDYDNLITCDLVCNGVPSPYVFKSYLSHLEKENGSKANFVKFKDKRNGWHNPTFIVKFENGKEFAKNINDTPFGRGFGQALFLRKSCSKCEFAKPTRIADFTLGDFWGLGKEVSFDHDMQKGITMLLVNSPKAEEIIKELPQKFTSVERDVKEAQSGNSRLLYPLKESPNRDLFFNDFTKKPFEEILNTHLKMPGFIYKLFRTILSDELKDSIRKIIK